MVPTEKEEEVTIRICEKWDLPTPVAKHNEWFADWALRKPNEVSRHITMGYHALQEVHSMGLEIDAIYESFGGIGAQALIIEDLWPGSIHLVRDFSEASQRYLKENLPRTGTLTVLGGSSYDPRNFQRADLQVADVGDLTAVKWTQQPIEAWLEHTFSSGAKAVVLTDIAGRLLHLHSKTYSKALGKTIRWYSDYLLATGEYVKDRFGYTATKSFYHHWSSITVFTPESPDPHQLVSCPDGPRGLEIL